jgi:hypothetical protein
VSTRRTFLLYIHEIFIHLARYLLTGSVIKVVHEAGLAIYMVGATKIMVTRKNRCALSSHVRFILHLCAELALARAVLRTS